MPHAARDLEPIAIIGLACRFPGGANSPEELWQMLAEGRSGWSEIPADRYNWKSFYHPDVDAEAAHNQTGGGYIDRDLAAFDAAFFNIPAAEANGLDPQQRIQLETTYEALENAGLPLDSVKGSKTSVHVATVSRDYDRNAYRDPQDLAKYHLTGCGEAITSGRLSHAFDLRGPCFSLDTGCSGSLVGLHLAVQDLRSGQTDMAVVGGTNLLLSPDMTMAMSKLHMLNDDGKCYAFDSRGKGYARSEGVSTIVLKRLSDAVKARDPIRAIIRNTGTNQDGRTNGIMLPNPQAQEDLMRSIHVDAGLDPALTTYVEAHGTGTQAGDQVEISSITNVFCNGVERHQPLFVGSIKANFGHCESASGLAGLIKTVLSLEKGLIPATPDVMNIKEGLDLKKRNIRIPQRLENWPSVGVRRAAINSFGYGGSNVAAILDSYQAADHVNGTNGVVNGTNGVHNVDGNNGILFVASAKAPKSLIGNLEALKTWLSTQKDTSETILRRLAYTLSARRSHHSFRTSFIASTPEEFLAAASSAIGRQQSKAVVSTKTRLTFVFTGQGAQWYAMGRELLRTQSSFASSMQKSNQILLDLGASWSLFEELSRDQDDSRINESEIAQPASTALQIALVDLLESLSIQPSSVIGHSSGEIAAAYAAGVLSHAAALKASFHRSKVSQLAKQIMTTRGGMLVTSLEETETRDYIDRVGKERLSLACVNSPGSTTISGDRDAIEELKTLLEGKSIMAKVLAVDVAYHSHHMRAVAEHYLESLQGLEPSEPRDNIQFFSSVTGERKTSDFGGEYWVQNLVSTVRFSDALLSCCKETQPSAGSRAVSRVLLEIGPHSALAAPSKQTLTSEGNKIDHKYFSALVRGKDAHTTVLTLAGKLFEAGLTVNIEPVNEMRGGPKHHDMILDLPPYAWDFSNKYWHESRLSREYRFRKHPHHDLLGLRLIGSTPLEPVWRNILSIDAQPWLNQHIIDGFAILPGASFLTMAMEAARQLNEERGSPRIKRFRMKNVHYFKAIQIPESPGKIEVMISVSTANSSGGAGPRDVSEWESFKITSSNDTKTWAVNCRGYIKLEYDSAPNEVDGGREEQQALSDLRYRLSQTNSACSNSIDHESLYGEMRQNGIDYGSNFATIQELRIGDCQAIGRVVIPDVAQSMPSGYQQPHTIHPATFDALMHIVLPLYFRHCTAGTAMLTSIEEVSVAADMVTAPGSSLTVCAALSPSGPRSGSVDVSAFQDNDMPAPVVILRGQKFQGTANSTSTAAPATYTSSPFYNIHRPVTLAAAVPGVINSLCFVDDETVKTTPLKPDEVEIKALAYGLDSVDVDIILGRSSDLTSIGECAGIVTALGSDFKHTFQIGDRVCCWNSNVAFASHTRVKGSFVQKIPDSWSVAMAAALPQNVALAYYALHDCGQVSPGQTVLVHGAGGPLGQAVALVGNLLGVRVIGTVKTAAEKKALAVLPGIEPAQILYFDDAGLPQAILHLTGGAGMDAVLNTSPTPFPEELIACTAPFGTIVNMCGDHSSSSAVPGRAVRHVSWDAAQLLRHRPSAASDAFKTALSLLPDETLFFPVTALTIADVGSAFKALQGRTQVTKVVLVVDENSVVNVKDNIRPTNGLTDVERIIQAVTDLSIPQDQKNALLALVEQSSSAVGSDASSLANGKDQPSSAGAHTKMSVERRLAIASSMVEARQIILEEQMKKIASLVALSADQLDPHEPLVDLGLDSLIAIEFKNWVKRTLGANIRGADILDSPGLEGLATLIAEKSEYVPDGLPQDSFEKQKNGVDTSPVTPPKSLGPTNGASDGPVPSNGTIQVNPPVINGASKSNKATVEYCFVPNRLPNFPMPNIDALCDAFLLGVQAFASPEEFINTIRAVEEFKRPGGAGQRLYDRATARAADPKIKNWEFELQLQRGFLDRRASLTPWNSFWFSHPLSKRQHSQAERAALLAYTANNYKARLYAGLVKPVVLNEQELTTAYHEWIFNAVRIPRVGSDEMQRLPDIKNNYCVVFWKGNAFKLNLSAGAYLATYSEILVAFKHILSQPVERSYTTILTSDNRHPWAEARTRLQQLDSQNAASIATIEAAAFTVSLDEATPTTGTERGRQFHFGGDDDAANRWHDKSIQFAVCSNGVSGTIGEHTMMDALTLDELNKDIADAINSYPQIAGGSPGHAAKTIAPIPLPLKTDAALEEQIHKVQAQYTGSIKDAEQVYFLFEGYGSKWLRGHKLPPKSVFQMVIQLASHATVGYTNPCWETVNQAHYHLGRVDIIQVINPQVAAFLAAVHDPSISMVERRELLVKATRAHVTSINKAGKNLGWERNMTALRALLNKGEEVPSLYEDPVYKRVRPRVMMSNCFETGMLEKGCMWKDPEAVWSHYEVYDESVYFSIVASKLGRATLFAEKLKEAATLVEQIILS
ncbi:hypothetical protein V493_03667 [Pseudogymnoascus sp. VKM F-4281 (FW-2241)]|nr:hypothetical protein V493_03667 [Pseudogymnoascus sp. VKM F-4281 (FW-2241)]